MPRPREPITSDISYVEMQQDISVVSYNMLSFNITKCKCVLLTNKRNIQLQTIIFNNQSLPYVQHYNTTFTAHLAFWPGVKESIPSLIMAWVYTLSSTGNETLVCGL